MLFFIIFEFIILNIFSSSFFCTDPILDFNEPFFSSNISIFVSSKLFISSSDKHTIEFLQKENPYLIKVNNKFLFGSSKVLYL